MTLTYQDVISTDLSSLLKASEVWRRMGDRFGELRDDYTTHVTNALGNGTWQGDAFGAHRTSSRVTSFEYAAAKKEAHAVAGLLEEAHGELARLQKAVKDLVADAEAKDYRVAFDGRVEYIGDDKLSPQARTAFDHDPDRERAIAVSRQHAQEWAEVIASAVRAVDTADQGVRRALVRAAADTSMDGDGFGGFNAHGVGGLAEAGAVEDGTATRPGGWISDGKSSLTGPDLGFTVTGPKYGKEGTVKAYADLFHATADGTLTRGDMTLSGVADGYGGARATANLGITGEGLVAKTEVSAGLRGLTEGRVEYGHVGAYSRLEAFAGGEAAGSLKATKNELTVGGKAFAGAKGGSAAGVEVAGIGLGGTAEGWKGVGAEAWWGYKKDETTGEYKIGGKAGLSPAMGGAVGLEITVDPGEFAHAAGDAARAVGDAVDAVVGAAGSAKKTVADWF
ncbi:hypothetical protein [Streptomyces sp. NRRL B-1381]|uniref:hypothetical protein n=1 Tax=Streptomyces sp. NRRL B-1381 TaxID=1463829 RepID=UPI0004BF0BAA|nr:hypothetical protein [Streptomyces sp. NRRL B-1381]